MRILITGGTGFLGSHIVKILSSYYSTSEINLLIRNEQKAKEWVKNGINCVKGDITKRSSVDLVMSKINPDIIIHSAGLVDDWSPLDDLFEVNVTGTQNLIQSLIEINPKAFFIHISSSGVYPRKPNLHIPEEHPYGPYANYHKSKHAAELIVKKEMEEIDISIIRPPNIIGIRDTTHMLKICKSIKNGKFPLISDGKAIMTWVSATDVAEAIHLIIKKRAVSKGEVFNVNSFEISVKDFYEIISDEMNLVREPKRYPYFLAYSVGLLGEIVNKIKRKPFTLSRYRVLKFSKNRLFDDTKIRKKLGYQPKSTAKKSIKETVNWLQQNGLI